VFQKYIRVISPRFGRLKRPDFDRPLLPAIKAGDPQSIFETRYAFVRNHSEHSTGFISQTNQPPVMLRVRYAENTIRMQASFIFLSVSL
jgi:hypothetical protein